MTSQIERLKSANPDAILDVVVPPTLDVLFLRQVKAAGLKSTVFGINTLVDPSVTGPVGSGMDGIVVENLWDQNNKNVASFLSLYRQKFGTDAQIVHTHIYMVTALLVLKDAVEKANSVDGSSINSALQQTAKFPAGFGQNGYTVNWTPSDHNGSGLGSIVFEDFQGKALRLWSVYQPK